MLSKIPDGYKVAFENKSPIGSIIEMIPEGESLSAWTEMLTVQVLRNTNGWTLAGFHAGMKKRWEEMCPYTSTVIVERGQELLYPTLIWSHSCPRNQTTGKPENTWFKVLIRDGNIIIAQKAFKFKPAADVVAFWIAYLKDLRVNHCL